MVSSSIHSSDEEYYEASNNISTVERSSISCESDSDLESIPTVSHFKQHIWKRSQHIEVDNIRQRDLDQNKEGIRKIFNQDKKQYIKEKLEDGNLVHSGKLSCGSIHIKIHGSGSLLTSNQDNFVARIRVHNQERLDFTKPFIDVKRKLSEKLVITEILKDELLNKRNEIYSNFKKFLLDRSNKTADNLECAEDLLQFSIILGKYKKLKDLDTSILINIANNNYISTEFKDVTQGLLNIETALHRRNKNFPRFDDFAKPSIKNLLGELQEICNELIECHRKSLRDKYSSYGSQLAYLIISNIDALTEQQALHISNKDINLFSDLANAMDEQLFSEFLDNLQDSLFRRVNERRMYNSLKDFAPLSHPIYFYLCKSFQELILEISGKTDISVNDLLKKNEQGKWDLMKTINWPSTSSLNHSLEQQYRFIFKLMKHFKPGYYSSEKNFEYKFKLLQNFDDKTLWQCTKSLFNSSNAPLFVSQDRLVWVYILDNAIANLLSKEELKSFEPLIQGYTNFVKNAESDHYESFRIATHNVIRFIAQTSPYLSKGVSETILTKQIESIKQAFSGEQSDNFRDLVDVYNEYWKNRQSILEKIPDKFPYGKFKENMEKICQTLLDIASTALDKKAKSQGFIKYFRSFNEFIEDLNDIEFSWFIKKDDINGFTEVELVNADKDSYKVLNPENFINKNCQKIPNHYIIEITQNLLNRVSDLLRQKKWSDDDNLSAASELLSAIKKSFLYLKEQPNYRSFYTFEQESTKPFTSAVENSSSYEDFKKRIGIIGESFWYLRKQDEIDIEKALILYRKDNDNSTEEILKTCYNKYLEKFKFYIDETVNKSFEKKIKFITEEVKKQSKQIKINEWNSKFKRETLPELLAGLAAVWSIQESIDIASTGKSLKPHCIQILSILRLLSVDKDSKGVDKHLAQVLTGQGKSLVLGLLSSLLALTGHKVRTVCYSEYLATRDQQDFDSFFKNFGIRDKITYGTFEEMANEVIMPEVNGKKQGLRELVEGCILNHSSEQTGQIKQGDINNSILLIDEVDVFFSDQFYGSTYGACNTIHIPGLDSIQEKIWEMASKSYEKSTILIELGEFINKKIGERNQHFKEFNKFLFKPKTYYLLGENEDNVVIKKEYKNKSLYEEHLEKMVNCAIDVANGSDKDWYINKYKINDDGIISYRKDNGIYSIYTYSGYYNIFNYFRLKKKDFDSKNYGYLNISCGKVSYAKLPKEYPLILGVSGTLTALDAYEKKAVEESYNISKKSIMPSFFGDSHLNFDSSRNFISQDSEEKWLNKIFNHTISNISSGRSVLIFFDTDVEIDKFKKKFLGKFDRLHTLTENTKGLAKEKYIDEAGITKTVTLATRGMGRGVDFKSSVAVEKSGGVHVIQTFFSLDIKEEIQIKGRTARKDNKGSYELILCKEHLINARFLEGEEAVVNYDSLSKSREQKIKTKGSNNEKRIEKSESNHNTTMDFLESFFSKRM
ncbi:uncharacterized protein LOC117600723 isoform X1 [Osmia lignaria lignaria]|uniref:uncharacterized protein LOC117600723 isoform X1 n=1 Tax=Osmia lignaria lignaria TaxID=1437193 RepID=UPI00402B62FE